MVNSHDINLYIFLCQALDFSDDEKEKEAKQRRKNRMQGRKKLRSEFNESGELMQHLVIFYLDLHLCKFISNSTEENIWGFLLRPAIIQLTLEVFYRRGCSGIVTGQFFKLKDVKMASRGKRQTKPC